MKRHIYTIIILILPALLVLSACTDPVFYTISQEVRSRDARIKGSPSNIVEFDDYMYVASNALFRYRGGGWQVAGSPPEKKINQVAATNNYLYLLCSSGSGYGNFTLHRFKPSSTGQGQMPSATDWENVNTSALSGYRLFSICADGGLLFAGAWNGQDSGSPANYALFYDDGGILKYLASGTGNLSGVAFDDSGSTNKYFLSTGWGVYLYNASSNIFSTLSGSGIYPGIIQLNGQTVAVDRGGYLYTVSDSGLSSLDTRAGYRATGALAVWSNPANPSNKLLLVGIQGSSGSSNYGYRELTLDGNGELPSSTTARLPGSGAPSSITDGNSGRYETTLGHRAVNYLHQATSSVDGGMTLFASTVKDGLFSYRDRNGVLQWNAEE